MTPICYTQTSVLRLSPMRRLPLSLARVLALAVALAAPATAQQPPPQLEPVPEPPPQVGLDASITGTGVTITPGGGEKVEEYSIDGRRFIRVIQPNGYEYYLIEERPGDGFAGTQASDSRIRAAQWLILQF